MYPSIICIRISKRKIQKPSIGRTDTPENINYEILIGKGGEGRGGEGRGIREEEMGRAKPYPGIRTSFLSKYSSIAPSI